MIRESDTSLAQSVAPVQCQGLRFLASQELTVRERLIWTLMASGCSDAEIAQRLAVNGLTVRCHVGNLLVKLGVSDRQEAVILAKRRGRVAGATEL